MVDARTRDLLEAVARAQPSRRLSVWVEWSRREALERVHEAAPVAATSASRRAAQDPALGVSLHRGRSPRPLAPRRASISSPSAARADASRSSRRCALAAFTRSTPSSRRRTTLAARAASRGRRHVVSGGSGGGGGSAAAPLRGGRPRRHRYRARHRRDRRPLPHDARRARRAARPRRCAAVCASARPRDRASCPGARAPRRSSQKISIGCIQSTRLALATHQSVPHHGDERRRDRSAKSPSTSSPSAPPPLARAPCSPRDAACDAKTVVDRASSRRASSATRARRPRCARLEWMAIERAPSSRRPDAVARGVLGRSIAIDALAIDASMTFAGYRAIGATSLDRDVATSGSRSRAGRMDG